MPSVETVATPEARERPTGRRAGIAAVAAALPERIVGNDAIASRLGVDGDWIASRTGVRERRVAAPGESVVDLATAAAQTALERADVAVADLDLVLVATFTHETLLPNAAPQVALRLGARGAGAIDVGAACTGSLSALELAGAAIEAGRARSALVIGAEVLSTVIDYDDRRTAGLFGDGAGAILLDAGAPGELGPIRLHSDGSGADLIAASNRERKIRMDGRPTFRAAVARLAEVTLEVTAEAGTALDEIDLFVYHQANSRILSAVAERLGLDPDRVVDSIALHGNTSAASIPIALDRAVADGRLVAGDKVLLAAFGAGLTWGAGIVEWGAS
jgi:3-oxoacyl-[acyl-carrier-protein] synthase III